ncbi:hypothetical protein C7T35_09000 [Variovorax sp. WS11]|nr:hypothetical protein C7T35_09000 [Variovorax sp. WS11]
MKVSGDLCVVARSHLLGSGQRVEDVRRGGTSGTTLGCAVWRSRSSAGLRLRARGRRRGRSGGTHRALAGPDEADTVVVPTGLEAAGLKARMDGRVAVAQQMGFRNEVLQAHGHDRRASELLRNQPFGAFLNVLQFRMHHEYIEDAAGVHLEHTLDAVCLRPTVTLSADPSARPTRFPL